MAHPLAPQWLAIPDDANALEPGLWPENAERRSDELTIAGVSTSALVREFGTPLYVIDEQGARDRAIRVRQAFEGAFRSIGGSVSLYYAGKAFLSIEVVRWMLEAGLGIDVCSGGELAVALAAGADAAHVGFHGNNKSAAEVDAAVGAGVGVIVLDSQQEIERVAEAAARHGLVQAVRLRVNSGVHAHTHEFLATAHEDQKFGIALADVPATVSTIRDHSALEFRGLHCHIGSQIFGSDGFAESALRLLRIHAELLRTGPVPELNLGGGFGIAYTTADDPTPIDELAGAIARVVAQTCDQLGIPIPQMAFEPGRVIIGPAGLTLYTAGTIKPVVVSTSADAAGDVAGEAVRTYVSVDGGMSDNVRPALYGAEYSVRIANRISAATPILVRIAGKHCESGDIVVKNDYLPGDVRPGDLLAVPATGAYCWSLASNYNYLGRPAVVAVRDSVARALIRRETQEDLLSRDTSYTKGSTS